MQELTCAGSMAVRSASTRHRRGRPAEVASEVVAVRIEYFKTLDWKADRPQEDTVVAEDTNRAVSEEAVAADTEAATSSKVSRTHSHQLQLEDSDQSIQVATAAVVAEEATGARVEATEVPSRAADMAKVRESRLGTRSRLTRTTRRLRRPTAGRRQLGRPAGRRRILDVVVGHMVPIAASRTGRSKRRCTPQPQP